ncbi:IclR family transcriptional regulator [Arthrobacter sp. SDTb3-6]|uniref:IclR family transcriptional regulator n=1 Tax=Arthrobacter sp. SDTb3-6 TaxID=2713571 RepID=UPI00159E5623|nr:IclR family transcriptional regulator [Arthrobacter sp. SDTb3-6]NVN00179.1 IclR family transcriptional regulator [Arthrobacter sp. SDTb3-6]
MSITVEHQRTKECDARQQESGGTASVVRALQLLDVFMGDQPVLGVSEIGRRAGIPTSTVHRLLSHLVKGGFVAKDGSNYRLSGKLFELGNQVAHSRPMGLRDLAAPFLGELFGATRLTTHLAVLDGPQVVLVDKVVGLSTHPARTVVGGRYPAVCTSLGKAMLAFASEDAVQAVIAAGMPRRTRFTLTHPSALLQELAQIRNTRLAYDREEATLGQTCIAAPILRNGAAIGAISFSGATNSYDLANHGATLVRVTTQLARQLGRRG